MTRRIAVTVRLPGARIAPVMRTFTCCPTGREHIGAKTAMTRLNSIGSVSIALLSWLRNVVLSPPIDLRECQKVRSTPFDKLRVSGLCPLRVEYRKLGFV